MLCAVGRSNRRPTSSPKASDMASARGLSTSSPLGAVDHEPKFGSTVMAFTTSLAVNARASQISRRMLNAADAADASSSPASPARITSVQLNDVPIKPAAYSIGHPTRVHQDLNRGLRLLLLGSVQRSCN